MLLDLKRRRNGALVWTVSCRKRTASGPSLESALLGLVLRFRRAGDRPAVNGHAAAGEAPPVPVVDAADCPAVLLHLLGCLCPTRSEGP